MQAAPHGVLLVVERDIPVFHYIFIFIPAIKLFWSSLTLRVTPTLYYQRVSPSSVVTRIVRVVSSTKMFASASLKVSMDPN